MGSSFWENHRGVGSERGKEKKVPEGNRTDRTRTGHRYRHLLKGREKGFSLSQGGKAGPARGFTTVVRWEGPSPQLTA